MVKIKGQHNLKDNLFDTISNEQAEKKHGIKTRHDKVNTNGELRFRLESRKDKTAYIRTATFDKAAGWQNPHYHKGLSETYIVQEGKIIFAEIRNDEIMLNLYKEGDSFTTEAYIAHNIYMYPDSVIHTVKHGNAVSNEKKKDKVDWYSDNYDCKLLTTFKQCNPQHEELEKIIRDNKIKKIEYGEDYRHFDNLIWQIPLWATAVFSLFLVLLGSILRFNPQNSSIDISNIIIKTSSFNISLEIITGIFVLFLFLILCAFSYTLFRFRCHQARLKSWKRTPRSPLSPQLFLQALVNCETLILLEILVLFFASPMILLIASIIVIVILALVTIIMESRVNDYSKSASIRNISATNVKVDQDRS